MRRAWQPGYWLPARNVRVSRVEKPDWYCTVALQAHPLRTTSAASAGGDSAPSSDASGGSANTAKASLPAREQSAQGQDAAEVGAGAAADPLPAEGKQPNHDDLAANTKASHRCCGSHAGVRRCFLALFPLSLAAWLAVRVC
jgi:hypothetical protein